MDEFQILLLATHLAALALAQSAGADLSQPVTLSPSEEGVMVNEVLIPLDEISAVAEEVIPSLTEIFGMSTEETSEEVASESTSEEQPSE